MTKGDHGQLRAVAEALEDQPDDTLKGLMDQAREAQGRTNNKLEDLAREIADDKHRLIEKIGRFKSICGDVIDLPERIQGQTQ